MAAASFSSNVLLRSSFSQKSGFSASSWHPGSAHTCSTPSCSTCGRKRFKIKASLETGDASSGSPRVDVEASFASLTASEAIPAQTVPYNGPGTGTILATGLLTAAGIIFAAQKVAGGSSSALKRTEEAGRVLGPSSKLPSPAVQFATPPRSVTKAALPALHSMATHFPHAIVDTAFVHACATELFSLGFTKTNCIALVNTCRDEVCRPLASLIDEEFGLSFNLSGLGGLINSGRTGFRAGMSHSPEFPCDVSGRPRERYVFFAFPHVSVGESGEVGSLLRRGRGKPSSACGALIAIQSDAKAGKAAVEDVDDAEYVLLKKKVLASHLCSKCGPGGPDLVTVTKAALEVITSDLEKIVSKVVDPATADYAVITGIQIHSGDQLPGQEFKIDRTIDYIAPGTMYAVIQGKKYDLQVSTPTPVTVAA